MIQPVRRYRWHHLALSVLAWMGAATLFSLVRLYGVEEEALYRLQATHRNVLSTILAQGFVGGLLFGLLFGLSNLAIDRTTSRKTPYWILIMIRGGTHLLLAVLVVVVLQLIPHMVRGEDLKGRWLTLILESPTSRTALVILIYTGVVSVLFSLLRQISDMFGPGIMFNILSGKYYRPQEEERIFMFLDLKSSTTYAERLGHVLYSELIQDCFVDLTEAIERHDVEVYQYVGDEAVLTWQVNAGLRNANCIDAYFTFDASIQRRARYYFDKYDLVPAFKAGVNLGMVMVAEVGIVKKEIAYHSDVLSTAARIQSQCNQLGQRLLISADMLARLPETIPYQIRKEGAFSLRGKEQEVILFSVNPPNPIDRPFAFAE
jgi:adenylate cyclase